MRNNHYLAAALALGLLITPLAAFADQNKTGYVPKPVYNHKGEVIGSTRGVAVTTAIDWQLPDGYQIFDMQEGDVTGDGTHDRVYLIGHKPSEASNYADSIKLIVENGADQTRKEMALEKMGGYESQLFLGDFTGDHVADALVTAASGGSGGWYDNKVVTFTQEASIIFSHKENSGNSVSGQFIDGYKVEIYNAAGGSAVTLDVGERKADYTRLGLYDKSGVLKKQTKIMVTPFGKLEPVDVNNDGVYELKGLQRISGAYNADGLANVETVLSYTGNDWQARSVSLHINLLPPKMVKPVPTPNVPVIERRSFVTESAEVYYPQVTGLDSFITRNWVNSELEKVAATYRDQGKPGAKTVVDYQVTSQDQNRISVIFTGYQQWEGGKYDILQAVNMDLKERNILTAKNLFKKDKASHAALTTLLQEAASQPGASGKTPIFGDWMGVYFTQDNVVFYYLENDFATAHTKLSVPLEKVQPYLNRQ